ncbi:MAG: hypothetical protein SPI18_06315 [Prevotella sp.]|nr:hypothetical protein [Prevotella sp.]MDY6130870.1 hypothetical protein [Prevotella sp.]
MKRNKNDLLQEKEWKIQPAYFFCPYFCGSYQKKMVQEEMNDKSEVKNMTNL